VSVKSGPKIAFLLLLAAGWVAASRIPSSTQIQIRLTKEVNTATAKVGDTFEALVIAPVVVDGHIAMAAGATVAVIGTAAIVRRARRRHRG